MLRVMKKARITPRTRLATTKVWMIKAERLTICCSSTILELMIDCRRAIIFSRQVVSSSTRALGSVSGGAMISGGRSPARKRGEVEETGFEGMEGAEGAEGAGRCVDA